MADVDVAVVEAAVADRPYPLDSCVVGVFHLFVFIGVIDVISTSIQIHRRLCASRQSF
jgi:hypothetical protein